MWCVLGRVGEVRTVAYILGKALTLADRGISIKTFKQNNWDVSDRNGVRQELKFQMAL